MTALKAVVNSETTYYVATDSEYTTNGQTYHMFSNSSEGVVGVTLIPGANHESSPDNNVHIYTSNLLSPEQQVGNTAHELYGHGYFYELKQQGYDVNPFHSTNNVEEYLEYDQELKMEIPVLIRGQKNNMLEIQINTTTKQAISNYNKRFYR